MISKHIIFRQGLTIIKALKGQNHQHRATPCDWMTQPFQALKGRHQTLCRPFRAQICVCIRFIGRCPMLMLKGFQP